jgi:fibronectin type 3 domain-containing protein
MDGVTLNWSKSKGATKYAIYRKTATGTSYKKIATVTATTYNDKSAAATNPTAYSYKVAAVKGSSESVKSDEKVVVYVPKSNGDNRYYTDAQNNAHVKLYLNKGDVYAEGKALADYLSLNGMYEAKVTEGADVVTVENGVITAKNAGTAVVEITVSDAAAKLVKDLNDGKILGLSNNTVFVEITVK